MSSTAITEQEIMALKGEALDKAVEKARFGPHEFFFVTADGDDLCRVDVGGYSAWKSELMLREWFERNQSEGYATDICIVKRPRDVNRPFVVQEHVPRYSDDEAGLFLVLVRELQTEFIGLYRPHNLPPYWMIQSQGWGGGFWCAEIRMKPEHGNSVKVTGKSSLAACVCKVYLMYRAKSDKGD